MRPVLGTEGVGARYRVPGGKYLVLVPMLSTLYVGVLIYRWSGKGVKGTRRPRHAA